MYVVLGLKHGRFVIEFIQVQVICGAHGAVVEALRYKPEGRRIDS
jgi:hypothetical protein